MFGKTNLSRVDSMSSSIRIPEPEDRSGTAGSDRRITSLYICYLSLNDPICQTQSLANLRELAKLGHRFALMTFEQPKYAIDPTRARDVKEDLERQGIYWYPLRYHRRFPVLATGFDCLSGVLKGLAIALRHKPRLVHSRSSIPAAMAIALSRLCGLTFLYDAENRLSEEYADIGHWNRQGLAYRLTHWFENLALKRADAIIVLSETARDDMIREFKPRAQISVIPCCVDTKIFEFSPASRLKRRRQLGLGDERLFVYVGKLGSWYLVDEMFDFYRVARARVGPSRLLVVTGDSPCEVDRLAERHGLVPRDYHVTRASQSEVVEWLSASDAGLAFIRSVGSKRGTSLIKVGEYLSAGLPVVMTEQIGDSSALVQKEGLGVVVSKHSEEAYLAGANRLNDLWAEGADIRDRCRKAAEDHLDLERVGQNRYREIYERLIRTFSSRTTPHDLVMSPLPPAPGVARTCPRRST